MESPLVASNLFKYLFLGALYLFILGLFWALWQQMGEFRGEKGERVTVGGGYAGPRHRVPILVAESGSLSGGRFPVQRELSIGRSPENGIVLPDPFVSSRHAKVIRQGNEIWLVDEGSRNGTFLNGFRTTGRSRLAAGDTFVIGDTTFRLVGE